MACSGHCNQCPAHPGYVGPGTATTFTDDPVDTTDNVRTVHYSELYTAIDNELTRRSYSWPTDPGTNSTGDYLSATEWRNLRDGIDECDDNAWSTSYPTEVNNTSIAAGAPFRDNTVNTMRDKIQELEVECVCDCNYACTCDCNYCVCNCNYCVCNCNYCVCNCNYCVCNCNHACVCNCAYSDERLKKEIVYI